MGIYLGHLIVIIFACLNAVILGFRKKNKYFEIPDPLNFTQACLSISFSYLFVRVYHLSGVTLGDPFIVIYDFSMGEKKTTVKELAS